MYIVVDINPQQPLLEAADPPRLAKVMLHIAFGMKVQDLWGCHSSCFQHSSFQLGCLKISQDQFVNSQHLGTHAKDVPQRPLRVFDTLDNSDLPSGSPAASNMLVVSDARLLALRTQGSSAMGSYTSPCWSNSCVRSNGPLGGWCGFNLREDQL